MLEVAIVIQDLVADLLDIQAAIDNLDAILGGEFWVLVDVSSKLANQVGLEVRHCPGDTELLHQEVEVLNLVRLSGFAQNLRIQAAFGSARLLVAHVGSCLVDLW